MADSFKVDDFIERKICIGLITNTEFLKQLLPVWSPRYILDDTARMICSWCIDHYTSHGTAPKKEIELIYASNLKDLSKGQAEWVEDILNSMSEEFEELEDQNNIDYLAQKALLYFRKRNLLNLAEDIQNDATNGDLEEAELLAGKFLPVRQPDRLCTDPFVDSAAVKRAFQRRLDPLITFPRALGEFWNHQFVREGLVALLAPEKRGKSFFLMDIAMRALRKGRKVAMFQAGDMSEEEMIRRMGIYLTGRSDMEKHCKQKLMPVLDCQLNQIDECNHPDRECNTGILNEFKLNNLVRKAATLLNTNIDYEPCRNCSNIKGAPWYKVVKEQDPLTWKAAYKAFKKHRAKYKKGSFRLSTHANETLSVTDIRNLLELWKQENGFVPDVIVIDYADIMCACPDIKRVDFRHQQNRIWQRLRALSQQLKCLVVTATQADARSYQQKTLNLTNFSEDKRKLAHVTAMFGLNQTSTEKKAGIMRINELVVRDDSFDVKRCVSILQCLSTGRPVISSFWGSLLDDEE